jgi:glycosyltransferase involved in cell wall biosynthesis
MRILCVEIGFHAGLGGSFQRNYQMARHLLDAGEDVCLLLTDKWLVKGETVPEYPFPTERLTVLPLLNGRYNVPLAIPWVIDRAVQNADVIHVDYLSAMAPSVCAAARRHRKPWVVCPAGVLPFHGRSLLLKRAFHQLWGARILRDSSRVIAITALEQESITPFVTAPDRIAIVPNAIDPWAPPSHSASDIRHVTGDQPHILYLGGFAPSKGASLLIEALSTLGNADLEGHVLIMAGVDCPERRAAETLAERLGVRNRIRFPGWLGGEEKKAALATASFVVIPSTLDAMTMVVLDAAAAGKPVLITDACGFPDVGRDGGGRVVEATVKGVADGLAWMFNARNRWPEMSRRMEWIAERYSWTVMTPRYLRLFRQVLHEAAEVQERTTALVNRYEGQE